MKNNLFGKATALVIGSLMILSGQALAMESNNNQELSNVEVLSESEFLIAAANDPLSEDDKMALAVEVASCLNDLNVAIAVLNVTDIPDEEKDALVSAFTQAQTIFGTAAESLAQAQTKGDARAIAKALSDAREILGPALSQAKAFAGSPGGDSLAIAAAKLETCIGSALSSTLPVAN